MLQDAIDPFPTGDCQTSVLGIVQALKFVHADPDGAAAIAKEEFPTMSAEDMKATLGRAIENQIWSKDAFISQVGQWNTAESSLS